MRGLKVVGFVAVLVFMGALMVSAAEESDLDNRVKEAIQLFTKSDSKIQKLFDSAYGYAVFPSITKGAIGIGGAGGRGEVFEKGKRIGYARMTQITIGAQLGGQEYAEVVFFDSKEPLGDFKSSDWAMSAQVSAVAAAEGASANAKYQYGVLVFTMAKGGFMFEASVGGQRFKFTPLEKGK